MLAPVQGELAGDEHGERAGRGRDGTQPGQDGLRFQRVGEFDDVRGLGAGEHGGRHRGEDGKHGRRVHQTALAHR
jgi:hypothetical protein